MPTARLTLPFLIASLAASLAACAMPGGTSPAPTGVERVASPSGRVEVTLRLNDTGAPLYTVGYGGRVVLAPSALGLELRDGAHLTAGFVVSEVRRSGGDETYPIVAGKSSRARAHFNELRVALRQTAAPGRRLDLVFRAYDDGAAFRYEVPAQQGLDTLEITAERSAFRFADDDSAWALILEERESSFEGPYRKLPLSRLGPDSLVTPPLVVETRGGPVVAITEANLVDYAGLWLSGAGTGGPTLVANLAPPRDTSEARVRRPAPLRTPWRVVMLGDQPGDLIVSDLLLHLSDPSIVADPSWIEPGRAAWPWWSGRVVTGAGFEGGMNTATQLHYIDFAAELGLEYLLIDATWYGPHKDPSQDITRTIPEIDMPRIIAYARERGVAVWLWLNWQNTDRQMDEAFPLYRRWGVRGVKVDYMNRDDQETVDFYHRLLRTAAEHQLMVDLHGAHKPTGIRRTYPHLLTLEGVMGLEHTKWSDLVTPEHNVIIPFTRMLAGPMDYTPGGFDHVLPEHFQARYTNPIVLGTRAHQLAMFVVYESPLQMVADHPSAYRGERGTEFLRHVPTTWDETRVLAGAIGDYIIVARRRGAEWYVGAMTDENARALPVPLDFLGDGRYGVTVYEDGPDAAQSPKDLRTRTLTLGAADTLALRLAPGGGAAVRLTPGR